jgi:hypothetical protein
MENGEFLLGDKLYYLKVWEKKFICVEDSQVAFVCVCVCFFPLLGGSFGVTGRLRR